MRTCSFCGEPCDSQIGFARELQTQYFGGRRRGIEYGPKIVSFFCNENHRNEFLATGAVGGEIQTRKGELTDE